MIEEETLLAVGFPGNLRVNFYDNTTSAHIMHHVFATCQSWSSRSFHLEDDLEEQKRRVHFGGMSGGPVFATNSNDYRLIGIISEGKRFADTPSGEIESNIIIRGFPLFERLLKNLLDR